MFIARFSKLVKWGHCHGDQSQREEDKHEKQQALRRAWRSGKLAPDKDTPAGGDHGCALTDGVGDSGADGFG